MKLHVENFAKIKKADIEINGITVIAGENNTGKSTIGKIMYCLYSIFNRMDIKVENERKRSITRALFNTNSLRDKIMPFSSDDDNETIMKIVNEIYNTKFEDLKNYIHSSTIKFSDETINSLQETMKFHDSSLSSLISKRYFAKEFLNQFLPLYTNSNPTILSLFIKNKNNIVTFDKDNSITISTELELIKDCIIIDNPFALDDIELEREDFKSIWNFLFGSSNILTHDDVLYKKLSKSLKSNQDEDLISYALLDDRLSKFKLMIKDIIHGDFIEKENEFLFLDYDTNKEVELTNLSTGIKSLAIILKLIENRDISDKSMIVLDEPEIHLHPKWQLEFAEILILLQKEFDLNIVLTSHSPYFINAIEVYSAKHKIADKCKYYLSDLDEDNRAYFEDVTTNTEKIYKKLAEPLRLLNDLKYGNR